MMNELCVPAKAVSLAGEDNQDVAPEVGDAVTLTVEGKIARVEGDKVYVTPESANGEAIEESETPQAPPQDTMQSLMAEAGQGQGGGYE